LIFSLFGVIKSVTFGRLRIGGEKDGGLGLGVQTGSTGLLLTGGEHMGGLGTI